MIFKGTDGQALLEQAEECFVIGVFLSCFPVNISKHLVTKRNPDYKLVSKLLTLEVETSGLRTQRSTEENVLSFKTKSGNTDLRGHGVCLSWLSPHWSTDKYNCVFLQ